MGEGLGPVEVGNELADHARHTAHHSDRRDRIVSIIEASLLAVVAVLAAWSGYASAKFATDSRLIVAEASTARNESSTAELIGLDYRLGDGLAFNAWFAARSINDADAMAVAERRFRPGFRPAFDAWIATEPFENPNAPAGPQAMKEYRQPEVVESVARREQAERLFAEGSDDGATGDEYVRTTVYLATVLFLVGISGHFRVRAARVGLVTIGSGILVFSVIQLITLPKPT
jgi:hypothetical protein